MTADWIAEQRRIEQAAPPLPYRYREGAEGDPSNGPTFTALEAEHPDLIWSEIARGDYDAWSGYGLGYAAEACNALPRALDAIEAALELHQPVDALNMRINRVQPVCSERSCGQENGDFMPWPCPTVRAIEKALAP